MSVDWPPRKYLVIAASLAPVASVLVYTGLVMDAGLGPAISGLGVLTGITANGFLIRGCYDLGTETLLAGGTRWPSAGVWALFLTTWVGISLVVGSVVLGLSA